MEIYPIIAKTLLHSLWQGFIAFILVLLVQRFLSPQKASLRYGVQAVILGGLLVTIALTFVLQFSVPSDVIEIRMVPDANMPIAFTPIPTAFNWTYLVVVTWLIGVGFFLLRLTTGLIKIEILRRNVILPSIELENLLNNLLQQQKSRQHIRIRLSNRISSPMAIGVIFPIILIPAGMLTGFSTKELEAIIIHELTHIRRRDFLVNLLQSLAETFLFFNPFVWIISGYIRREREFCCDDAVLTQMEPTFYATTLAKVQALTVQKPLVMSFAAGRFELLTRIKRMFEPQKTTWRAKLVPVLLLIAGLFSVSWISISTKKPDSSSPGVQADTTKKPVVRVYTRKSVTTVDSTGKPTTEVIESFEDNGNGQTIRRDTLKFPGVISFPEFPEFPEMPEMVELAELAELPRMDFNFSNGFNFQVAEPMPFFFDFRFDTTGNPQWEEFNAEFREKFQERFSGFYKKNSKEFDELMDEMKRNFSERKGEWGDVESMKQMSELHRLKAQEAQQIVRERMAEFQAEQQENVRKIHEKQREMMEVQRIEMDKQREIMDKKLKAMHKKLEKFQKEIASELIADGYLKKNESIDNLNFNDNGEIIINGRKIKSEHRDKYRKLHRKYFDEVDAVEAIEE